MSLNEIYSFSNTFDNHIYRVSTQKGIEPTADELIAFEREIGFKLPDDYREYALHKYGGATVEVREEIWPRGKSGDIGPAWSFNYGLYLYTLSSQAPDWINLRHAYRAALNEGADGLVPFLKVGNDPWVYCFTQEQKIVLWDEFGDAEEKKETFTQLILRQLKELEERKNWKVAGKK